MDIAISTPSCIWGRPRLEPCSSLIRRIETVKCGRVRTRKRVHNPPVLQCEPMSPPLRIKFLVRLQAFHICHTVPIYLHARHAGMRRNPRLDPRHVEYELCSKGEDVGHGLLEG